MPSANRARAYSAVCSRLGTTEAARGSGDEAPGSAGRDQDRGQVGQPLVQVADVEQVTKVGKLLIKPPQSSGGPSRRPPVQRG